MSKRIQVNVSDGVLEMVERLQKSYNGASAAEVLRDAVRLYDWARKQNRKGWHIGAFKDDGRAKEAILPFLEEEEE